MSLLNNSLLEVIKQENIDVSDKLLEFIEQTDQDIYGLGCIYLDLQEVIPNSEDQEKLKLLMYKVIDRLKEKLTLDECDKAAIISIFEGFRDQILEDYFHQFQKKNINEYFFSNPELTEIEIKDRKYWKSLMPDLDYNSTITQRSLNEVCAAIRAEKTGKLKGPLVRAIDGSCFVDALGQKWTVKQAISKLSDGKQSFNADSFANLVKLDLDQGENIILDFSKLGYSIWPNMEKILSRSEIERIIIVL